MRIVVVLLRYRMGLLARLAWIYCITPIVAALMPLYSFFYRGIKLLVSRTTANSNLRYWASLKQQVLQQREKGYRVKIEELGLSSENLQALKQNLSENDELIVARIDQDGYWLSEYAPIADVSTVPAEEFMKRTRFDLCVVVVDGYVGIRKDYRGDKVAFVNELNALYKLGRAGCNVPAILAIDVAALRLTISYIKGSVLQEELVKKGAEIRVRDILHNDEWMKLDKKDKMLWIAKQGNTYLPQVISKEQIDQLFLQLQKIHQCGIAVRDIKKGNLIREKSSGAFYWIDFDNARDFSRTGSNMSRCLRNRDIEKFNLHLGTEKLTYEGIRNRISNKNDPILRNWYAPVYLGAGLRIGSLWDCNAGYGRWHYLLKKSLPDFADKRILDLGANNGANGLQLLRYGAGEVVGIELDQHHINQGLFAKAALEWADNKTYNFTYHHASMTEVPELQLGKFDMAMAMCSIYYLDDDSIAKLIRFLHSVTEILVLQCNVSQTIKRSDPHVRTKSSVTYTVNMLKANGFDQVQVIAPMGYSRPLVIARKK